MILQDKTVLVTGSSKGIGQACIEAFAKEGANVIVHYGKDREAAEVVAKNASKHGVQAMVVQADITNQAEVDAMFATIKPKFQTVDVLVNCAGIAVEGDTPDNLEAMEKAFATDFFGQVRVTAAARQLMKQGKIIFVSSLYGRLGYGRPNCIGYSAAKAALESYMKNLARELAPDILVNAIAPGRTLTPRLASMDQKIKAERATTLLINRWVEPSEIADSVLFLAKNDAMAGEVLTIDGGMSLKVFG